MSRTYNRRKQLHRPFSEGHRRASSLPRALLHGPCRSGHRLAPCLRWASQTAICSPWPLAWSAWRRSTRRSFLPASSRAALRSRSEEHTSELQSLMRISYAVFCLKKKKSKNHTNKIPPIIENTHDSHHLHTKQ